MGKKKSESPIEKATINSGDGHVVVIFETSQIAKKGTEKTMLVEHADKLFKKGLISYK